MINTLTGSSDHDISECPFYYCLVKRKKELEDARIVVCRKYLEKRMDVYCDCDYCCFYDQIQSIIGEAENKGRLRRLFGENHKCRQCKKGFGDCRCPEFDRFSEV